MGSIHAMIPHLPSVPAKPVEDGRAKGAVQGRLDASQTAAPVQEKAAAGRSGPGDATKGGPLRSDRDEYLPGGEPQPIGRYWPEQDAEGNRRVRTDGQLPTGAAQSAQERPDEASPAADREAAAPSGKAPQSAEEGRCTVNTDKVDREIKRLKEEKAQLEQQLQREQDTQKQRRLQQKLDQIETELQQKDNDVYRRRHAEYSLA